MLTFSELFSAVSAYWHVFFLRGKENENNVWNVELPIYPRKHRKSLFAITIYIHIYATEDVPCELSIQYFNDLLALFPKQSIFCVTSYYTLFNLPACPSY